MEITGYMLTSVAHGGPDIHVGPGERVAFRTIGCKLNQCETAQMQEILLGEGYRLVGWDSTADVRVVNTCTVTAKSDRTCRREIRLAKRLDPDFVVVVTGCSPRSTRRRWQPYPRRRPRTGEPGQAAVGRASGGGDPHRGPWGRP